MKIIEIKQTRQGEVAYLYDELRSRVVKVWVEDMTQTGYDEEKVEPVHARALSRGRITPDELEEPVQNLPNLPTKPKPSIIPAHLQGVFLPADSPGAATEIRRM